MLISLMALLPIFGYLFVDFLFLAQTKNEFANNPETIAGFFGVFLGFVAIIELVFKLISGRFLNKYGLKPSLISLPLILLSGVLMAASFRYPVWNSRTILRIYCPCPVIRKVSKGGYL